jgi:hypothetical protein
MREARDAKGALRYVVSRPSDIAFVPLSACRQHSINHQYQQAPFYLQAIPGWNMQWESLRVM